MSKQVTKKKTNNQEQSSNETKKKSPTKGKNNSKSSTKKVTNTKGKGTKSSAKSSTPKNHNATLAKNSQGKTKKIDNKLGSKKLESKNVKGQEKDSIQEEIKEENIKDISKDIQENHQEDETLKKKEVQKKDKVIANNIEETPRKPEFEKRPFIKNLLLVTFYTFGIEIIFRLISKFNLLNYATLRIFLSTFILALIITFLASLTKRKWLRNTIILFYIFLYTIYSWLQLGFINFLGVYISFNTSSQFGAVTDYIYDFLNSFKPIYYVAFVPFILSLFDFLILRRKKTYRKFQFNKKALWLIPTLFISILMYWGTIVLPFMQNELQTKSNKYLFLSPDVPSVVVNQYGSVVFGILDFKSFIAPTEVVEKVFSPDNTATSVVAEREVSKALEEIALEETNKKYTNLNNYFASQKVTDYNDYTGMFEGKNVVVVLMESVNEAIINEKYFPNYYSLYSNGWHWENNYSPRNSCATGNNEFSAMTSLYSIYNTCTSNVYKNNTYFESIFNLFNNKGYNTSSMHDFVEWYYYRKTIHPNMGSGKYYGAKELNIKTSGTYGEWPSDEEFFEKAFDIILNDDTDKPFMTWLTTVTSHQPYSTSSTYGDLYLDYFKSEGYSTTVSRYLSKLKVVDNAIGIMIDKLTTAGKLEDTVIVLLADHYPYGLKKTQVAEMIDHNLEDYDIEKTPFLIYNPSMTPQTFSDYTSYINLVPTVANLMNLDYDPRLYMGTDLLSEDYVSRVVFADGSWKNENAYYNASTSKTTYYGSETYDIEELQNINNTIDLKMSMSTSAIKNNYFSYLEKAIAEYNANLIEINDTLNTSEDEKELTE